MGVASIGLDDSFYLRFVLQSALALLSKADRKLLDDLLILRNERVQFFLVHNEVQFLHY